MTLAIVAVLQTPKPWHPDLGGKATAAHSAEAHPPDFADAFLTSRMVAGMDGSPDWCGTNSLGTLRKKTPESGHGTIPECMMVAECGTTKNRNLGAGGKLKMFVKQLGVNLSRHLPK